MLLCCCAVVVVVVVVVVVAVAVAVAAVVVGGVDGAQVKVMSTQLFCFDMQLISQCSANQLTVEQTINREMMNNKQQQ